MPLFDELGLSDEILRALKDSGYEKPSLIQEQAIPAAMEGRDVVGCAQTGTGKTAAFGIPILEHLSSETFSREPRALVLTPTRELAQQIAEFLERYGAHLQLRVVVVMGGAHMGKQISALRSGCDIVVATPGRLIDLHSQGCIVLSKVKIAVLDEADRMLDMGFIPDVRRIMRMVPRHRQTLFFSATMAPEIEKLAADFLRDPLRIEVTPSATPVEKILQIIHPVDFQHKEALLDHILRSPDVEQALIFTQMKIAADRLADYLKARGHDIGVMHGDHPQRVRERALSDFKSGKTRILIATDLASRGLDVEGISHVINFDMPPDLDTYVHRVGRTARADSDGTAISLVGLKDWDAVKELERKIGKQLPRVIVPGFEPKASVVFDPGVASAGDKRNQKKRALRARRLRGWGRR